MLVDIQHLSWEPLVPKEPKQLNSPQLCVFECHQAHNQVPTSLLGPHHSS